MATAVSWAVVLLLSWMAGSHGQDLDTMTLPPGILEQLRASIADSQITVTNAIQGLVAVAVFLVIVGLLLGLNHFRWERRHTESRKLSMGRMIVLEQPSFPMKNGEVQRRERNSNLPENGEVQGQQEPTLSEGDERLDRHKESPPSEKEEQKQQEDIVVKMKLPSKSYPTRYVYDNPVLESGEAEEERPSPFKHWERDSELEDYLAHFMSPPRTMDSPILSRSYIMEFSQKFNSDPQSRSGVDNPGFAERPKVRTVRPALETEV
ncbi:Hypp1479 [Branchiostoma lanceolatum]|uniref:Hypp1479 protein n=1 Tax=Branchiostoma lanceolatum TaxID=7740 RepID=A0A8J9ZKQ5_BRALA|nr:Hypp1479 [Branchiostoma lanceolatum]